LIEDAVFARYSWSGHLLFVRDYALFAVPFDAENLRVGGGPVPVLDDVAWAPSLALGGFAVAPNGTLVVIKASLWKPHTQLVWVGRNGVETPALPVVGDYMHPRISPDGRRVVVTVLADGRRDLRLYDLARGGLSQVRRSPAQALRAVWAPTGRDLIYTVESPSYNLYRMPIDGTSPERPLVENSKDKFAASVSPDGRTLAYEEKRDDKRRIRLVALAGGPAATFEDSLIDTSEPAFSPDGRWIVYTGYVAEPTEVYLRAADGSGGRRQVSAGGGETPRWTKGGREVVYRNGDAIMAVSVDPTSGEAGKPALLFRGPYRARKAYAGFSDYDVTADGNRFLFVKPVVAVGTSPFEVTVNWFEELRAKLGR